MSLLAELKYALCWYLKRGIGGQLTGLRKNAFLPFTAKAQCQSAVALDIRLARVESVINQGGKIAKW